jgi:hypothetical protein
MGRPYKCPYCGQSESVGKGVRRTKTMGDRRIRLCTGCGRKFTPKNQKAWPESSVSEQKCGAETAGRHPIFCSAALQLAPWLRSCEEPTDLVWPEERRAGNAAAGLVADAHGGPGQP